MVKAFFSRTFKVSARMWAVVDDDKSKHIFRRIGRHASALFTFALLAGVAKAG